MANENLPSCRAKKGLSGSPHEPRNTARHAISVHKLGSLGLSELNWLWRPPQAAELLGAACGGLLALISLREIKPSSAGLDPSSQACIPSFSSAWVGLMPRKWKGSSRGEASAATEGRVGGAACASQILGGAACASQILVEPTSQHRMPGRCVRPIIG